MSGEIETEIETGARSIVCWRWCPFAAPVAQGMPKLPLQRVMIFMV